VDCSKRKSTLLCQLSNPHKWHRSTQESNKQVVEGSILSYLQIYCVPRLLIASSSCLHLQSEMAYCVDKCRNSPLKRWVRPILSPIHLQIPVVQMVYLDMSSTQHRRGRTQLPQNIRFERVPCPAWYACILPVRTCLEYHCPREQALHNSDALVCPTNLHADHEIVV
jgi:hypothetical protein